MDILFTISYGHFLVLAAVLFGIGLLGVILRRNALILMMSIELMLNAANMTILTFGRMWGGINGDMSSHALAFIVIAVAAAEAAVGLAIVVAVYRARGHADVDRLTFLKN